MLELPEPYALLVQKLVLSLVALTCMLLINRALRRLVRIRIADPAHVRTFLMLSRNIVFVAGSALILFVWLGIGSSFGVAMGILGAGIAFASQEILSSFAGYMNIITGSLFRIGDRIHIGSVTGDVVDISVMRTTVMEIGEWVQADQYTGRLVTIANHVVFSAPVFNYTQHWRYLWDEITIPITYSSDWQRAAQIMLQQGQSYTTPLKAQAQGELQALAERYPLHEMTVEPTLYLTMTDNWIELTLRYVVEAQERRPVKGTLHREILQSIESESTITVASATIEIVGFPSPGGGQELERRR